ncbi:MAG: 6-phosphofructokinase [Gemmatales bacterium]|nr:6-phosphofructokinase [Gemmatales bacterium]MDW7994798.1 6-phosphofructokinase [Gemmatales bacterium]
MATALHGNALIAQSGGPTAVINAQAYGLIQELRRYNFITGIYGADHGILGVLHEELFDLNAESPEVIEGLQWTPAAAIGSCRYKLKPDDYGRILEVFRAHEIRYFFYIGGNDSADTALRVHQLAQQAGYPLRVLGVMKTIDNDLMDTDHCPGYGSAAKYLATIVREAWLDARAMATQHQVVLIEAMGRNAGWLAAASAVARRADDDAPHMILLPERPLKMYRFLGHLEDLLARHKVVLLVVSEGIRDQDGRLYAELARTTGTIHVDAFGHKQLGGAAAYLRDEIERHLRIRGSAIAPWWQGEANDYVRARFNLPGTTQRNAGHLMSQTDRDEAIRLSQAAVRFAVEEGASGYSVGFEPRHDFYAPYQAKPCLISLERVANKTRYLEERFISADGYFVTQAFLDYVRPLLRGRVAIPEDDYGLPKYVDLSKKPLPKKLPPWR